MAVPRSAWRIFTITMSLVAAWTRLQTEFDRLSTHLRDFTSSRPSISSASDFVEKDECLLEGLLSRVWQAWGIFCRSCVCESCLGTTNAAGALIASHPDAKSESHVSAAAIRAKQTANSPWGGINQLLRNEPNWGDVDVLSKIIPRLGPSNQTQLLAAFSSGSQSAKALQLIRNAAAHTNAQSVAEVRGLQTRYIVFPITHPTHALYWVDPRSGDFLVLHAVEELLDAGSAAIS